MKFINIMILLLSTISLLAQSKDIPVTRDINADIHPTYSYQDYKQHNPEIPTAYKEIKYANSRDNNFLIIVDNGIYPAIENSINVYQSDLQNEDLNPITIAYEGSSVSDLRNLIISYYESDSIVGAVLIGNITSAWYEMYEDFDNDGQPDDPEMVEFPIDLYFADLDGDWSDLNQNGIFDRHSGEVHPEIWLGRIKADNLTYTDLAEIELLQRYFDRNHRFRNGLIVSPNNALAYIDDDWEYWGEDYQDHLEHVYDDVELINNVNETTAPDYRSNRLPVDYEFIQVHVHSWPASHYFYEDNGEYYQEFYNTEISPINPKAFFYNLFCCSNAQFEVTNNMGSLYLLANDHCLGTIGSTKTGSMLRFENFYQPLSQDDTFGEAMKQWWIESVDTGDDQGWERSWFYGMVFLGDPSLKQHYVNENIVYVDSDYSGAEHGTMYQPYNSIQEGIEAAEDGNIVLVNDGLYIENIIITEKSITLQSMNGPENCIINGNHNNTVVNIHETGLSTVILDGFTLMNGLGDGTYSSWTGGGITISNNAAAMIKNCNIRNNNCNYYGSAMALWDNTESTFENCKIFDNPDDAIYINNNNANFKNCLIYNNDTGLYIDNSNILLSNSTITNNNNLGLKAYESANIALQNSIVYGNNENIIYHPSQTTNSLFITHSNIEGGEVAIDFNDIGIIDWYESNITANPAFKDSDADDFHLSVFSPCIGAADSAYALPNDIDGNPRPQPSGSNPDIGCYESMRALPALQTIYVSTHGSDEAGTGEESNPFATINHACSIVSENASIIIERGTYHESVMIPDKRISINSRYILSGDNEDILETRINGQGENSVVKFEYLDSEVILNGLTIMNGNASSGGGVFIHNCNPVLSNLVIKENTANIGGGIYCNNANPIIKQITLIENTAEVSGSAVCSFNSEPVLINSILWDNNESPVYGAANIFYSTIEYGYEGEGNINLDPLLNEDYSLTENSPCIDNGTDYFEWGNNTIIDLETDEYFGEAPDMGALERYNVSQNNDVVNPTLLNLHNYPNPFNPKTTISFTLNNENKVNISVYNLKGQKIKTLVDKKYQKGSHTVSWEGRDSNEKEVASGIYFYKFSGLNGKNIIRKCALIK